jgi:hypothetical protein
VAVCRKSVERLHREFRMAPFRRPERSGIVLRNPLSQHHRHVTGSTAHDAADLELVAAELNSRPRMTLNWHTPGEALARLLSATPNPGAATNA